MTKTSILSGFSQAISFLQPLDGRGIRIRTLNDGVRGLQSFFKTAYISRLSNFASLKNLSEFYFCSVQQIRMRNCEPYTEVSKEALNPHYHLQQGTAPFGDEEYKSSSFNFTDKMSYMTVNKSHHFLHSNSLDELHRIFRFADGISR